MPRPPNDDRDALFQFEAQLDDRALRTGFAGLPRRTLLAIALGTAQQLCQGSVSGDPPRFGDGRALISRLSYLTAVLTATDPNPIGADAHDVTSPVLEDPQLQVDLRFLYVYSHLCELLPEIRRGSWVVTRSSESGFALSHPSDEFAAFEARDIVLSELALTSAFRPSIDLRLQFDSEVQRLPTLSAGFQMSAMKAYFDWHLATVQEQPLFHDAAMRAAFDVSIESFLRFRAVWMAWAEFILGMTDALGRRMEADRGDALAAREFPEWQVPCLSANFVEGTSLALTGIDAAEWDRLMRIFVYCDDPPNAGDGFFPPLHRLDGGRVLLFSADAIQAMLPMRNLAYALNQTDRERFDNLLSDHLEPTLIADASAVLATIPGVEIGQHINWERGEIDMVAVDVEDGFVLTVEAKAPIPPQGARMTAATQSRVSEGLAQIARFRELDVDEQRGIISRGIGRDLAGAQIEFGLLARCCLGTAVVWEALGDVVPFNLELLRIAVANLADRGARLAELPGELVRSLDLMTGEVATGWRTATLDLEIVSLQILLLDLDEVAMNRHRISAWKAAQP